MGCNPPSFFGTMKYRLYNPVSLLEWGTYYMAPFSNRAFTSCSITRTCWGATLVENTPINLGGRHPNCIWYPFSIVCRTQRDIFGRSFHAAKILLEVQPVETGFWICMQLCSQNDILKRRTDRKPLNWPLWNTPRRGWASQGHYVSGWTLRYALAGDRCTLKYTRWQGWQNGPLRTPKGDKHRKMRCWPLHFRGEVLIGLSPRASGVLPRSLLRNNNGPQIHFILRKLQLRMLPVSPFFRWESMISPALSLCGTVWGAGLDIDKLRSDHNLCPHCDLPTNQPGRLAADT